MVCQKNSAQDVRHEQVPCHDEAANHQLCITGTFWIIPVVSLEECSCLMQNLMQIHCSTHSVILNVMATQYTCSQWHPLPPLTSTMKWSFQWHMHIPVYSPWLLGYIDVMQTILVILTIAGLFPGRPHDFVHMWNLINKIDSERVGWQLWNWRTIAGLGEECEGIKKKPYIKTRVS